MKMKLKKDDLVEVISGDDKGRKSKGNPPKRGRVLQVDREKGLVLVEGVNYVTHHEKVGQTKDGRTGGIEQREGFIHASKVALVDPVSQKPVRVGTKTVDGKQVRVTKGKNASGTVLS